jgi:hypothetical protein
VADWRAFAACAAAVARGQAEMSLWFPTREDAHQPTGNYGMARPICASCPVRVSCLEEALTLEASTLSRNQRMPLVRERRRFTTEPPPLTGNGDRPPAAEPVVVTRDPVVVRQRSRASWCDDW